jgi:ABC-type uncharacterized transport system permease subunit
MLSFQPRAAPSVKMMYLSPLFAVLFTVLCGTVLFAMLGANPLKGLAVFFWEPIKNLRGWTEVGVKCTPLILCAVGYAVCYRASIWTIGAEGMLVAGAMAGGGVALAMDHGAGGGAGAVAVIAVAGILGGMAWAGLTAFMRDRFNTNEILVSLMLVYVAQLLLSYMVHGPWRDPQGYNFPQSKPFSDGFLMPAIVAGTRLNFGFVMALLTAGAGWLFLSKSFAGFRLQVGGMAPLAARYAGFSQRKALWIALLIGGATAGLAGVIEAIGPVGQLMQDMSPGYGFAAIIVAYLGRLHPVGIIFSSFIMALFYIGGELAQSRLGLPNAITGVFQGMLLFFLLACDVLIANKIRWGNERG